MNTDHEWQAIRTAIRDRLEQMAAELGELAHLILVQTGETGGTTWRLQPKRSAAVAADTVDGPGNRSQPSDGSTTAVIIGHAAVGGPTGG